jgi:Domain of unknown function (DUF4268)
MSDLGQLERIRDIRTIWRDEARDFTPWLAGEDNLSLLADTLGFGADGLELEAVEANVGPFRADILCRDANSSDGDRVLIENMYGRTDHDHIGKLMTYAAGLEARSVILICEELRPEHRAALDWLNDISADDHQFFGVTLELWRIGTSLPAPKFNVVVAPNNWVRQVRASRSTTLGETQQIYLAYWQGLADAVAAAETPLKARKPLPQSWTGFGIGRTDFGVNVAANQKERWIRAELYLHGENAKFWLAELEQDKTAIESDLGFVLDWDPLPGRTATRISITNDECNVDDPTDWPAQHQWLITHLSALHRVFHDRVRRLPANPAEGAE